MCDIIEFKYKKLIYKYEKFFLLTIMSMSCFLLFANITFAVDETTVEKIISNEFQGGGVAQGWNDDDDSWYYELPFTFNFYGEDYTDIEITSNGIICFSELDSYDCDGDYNIPLDDTDFGPFISPLNVDLMTDENPTNDIYITENTDNVIIRWDVVEYDETDQINFEVVLYSNGNIKFNYGTFDELLVDDAIVGITKGDGTTYTESIYHEDTNFNFVDTSFWSDDDTAPTLSEKTPVTTPTTDTTPDYTFNTDEAGTITYGGSCSSSTTDAVVGDNTITFNELLVGVYNDCTITVTDDASNVSDVLSVSTFTIEEDQKGDEEITQEDDSVSGTIMQKYKRYKEKYKNKKSKNVNKEIKGWKKGTAEEFAKYIEYRNIYEEYKHLSKPERKENMTPEDYEKYKMYKRYRGYKEYKKLRDKVK